MNCREMLQNSQKSEKIRQNVKELIISKLEKTLKGNRTS